MASEREKQALLEEIAENAAEWGRKMNLYAAAADRMKLGGTDYSLLGSHLSLASQCATKAAKEAVRLGPVVKVKVR